MHPNHSFLQEQLRAIQQQLKVLQDQLYAVRDQVEKIQSQLDQEGPPAPAGKPEAGPALPAQEALNGCGQDILDVLRQVGHPLTTLEILDELVRRQLRWRENNVRNALVYLLDHNRIRRDTEEGAQRYALK